MNRTKIDWCDYTWNPVVGCTGTGCSGKGKWCYAEKMARRFHWDWTPHWIESNFQRKLPRKPSRIFVNSMSDLADWEPLWRCHVGERIHTHPEHTFFFLTKRPSALNQSNCENVMIGYSATTFDDLAREENHLGRRISFLSIEPIHGPMGLDRIGRTRLLRWIIVGAETGNREGRVVPKAEWLREIFGFCQANNIPLFFKDSLRNFWPRDMHFPREFPKEMP
jgi:protein gp37